MTQKTWTKKIRAWCNAAGTYKPYFDGAIATLSAILARRDEALKAFEDSGGAFIVPHTNKGGSTNMEKNPAYSIVRECEQDALAYWRDLGLTPAGLRKINESAMKETKIDPLTAALRDLGG